MSLVFDVIFFLVATLFLNWCYGIYRKNKKLEKIPGPLPIPFIGVKLPRSADEINPFYQSMISKYGRTFKFYIGSRMTVATCDADLIQEILQSKTNIKKSDLFKLSKSWLKDGLIVSRDDKWRARRKLMDPNFHGSMLKEFFLIFRDSANILVDKLKEKSGTGTIINAPEFFDVFSLDIVGETSFGTKLDLQKGNNQAFFGAIQNILRIMLVRNFSIWKRFDFLFDMFADEYQVQKESLDIVNGLAIDLINTKRQEYKTNSESIREKKRYMLIDALLQHPDLSDGDILEEVNTFLFAGYDTISTLLSFSMHELAVHPEIQQKLYEEIILHTENNLDNLTFNSLQNMTYMDQVIKEVLRLRCPVSIIERDLPTDIKFGDIVYPSGTVITLLMYWIHNNSAYYPDPEKFDPERFTPENQEKRHPYSFIPFSSGLRNCIGQRYALLEAKTTLSRILMEFKLLPKEGEPEMEIVTAGVIRSKHGIPIKLQAR